MIAKKRFLPFLLALVLFMAGCGKTSVPETKTQEATFAGTQTSSESEPEAMECNWILEVDDTVENETDGVKYTYHLVLLLDKKDGTDKLGAYTGKLYLKTEQDVDSVQDEVFEDEVELTGSNSVESQADAVVINVVSYVGDTFAQFDFTKDSPDAPLAPLAPIGGYDAMALEKPELSHRQQYGVDMTFDDGDQANPNKEKVFNSPVTIKILIEGADVSVYMPSLKFSQAFKGTITGIPIS